MLNSEQIYPKIKIANSLHFLIAQAFLFCFHCGAISTFSPNTRVAIFPDKRISLRSITFINTILVESFMTGYTPFWLLLETHNFTFLCKQTSDIIIIIIKILTAIMYTFSFTKNCRGFFLKLDIFFSIWSCWCSCLCHVHKLSFHRILIILLRPLSAHALFENGRFNKDGQKNKREYINKPKRNACKDYLFHK